MNFISPNVLDVTKESSATNQPRTKPSTHDVARVISKKKKKQLFSPQLIKHFEKPTDTHQERRRVPHRCHSSCQHLHCGWHLVAERKTSGFISSYYKVSSQGFYLNISQLLFVTLAFFFKCFLRRLSSASSSELRSLSSSSWALSCISQSII